LNDCEMQHNAEVGLFTRPSNNSKYILCDIVANIFFF